MRNLLASQVPRAAVARVLAKAPRAVETQTSAIVVDWWVIDDLIALVETKVAVPLAKRGHLSRSSGGNASARAVEVEPAEAEVEREIQHVCGHCRFATILESRLTFCRFATTLISCLTSMETC